MICLIYVVTHGEGRKEIRTRSMIRVGVYLNRPPVFIDSRSSTFHNKIGQESRCSFYPVCTFKLEW